MIRTTVIAVAAIVAGILMSSAPATAADASFVECLFSKMRPRAAAGSVPLLGHWDEPASLIVARAFQRCEMEGHVPDEGVRWHIMDGSIEWIFEIRRQAHEYALQVCGGSCSTEILGRAYSEELRRLAYRSGRTP